MADATQAITATLGTEGGYVNNPADPGGETVWGISRVFHPEWRGWVLVDQLKPDIQSINNSADIKQLAVDFYRQKQFWLFDNVQDQRVANKLFDAHVNMDVRAIRIAQTAAGMTVGDIDGVWGPKTETTINKCNPDAFLSTFRVMCVRFRFQRVRQDPTQQKFLEGWVVRDAQ